MPRLLLAALMFVIGMASACSDPDYEDFHGQRDAHIRPVAGTNASSQASDFVSLEVGETLDVDLTGLLATLERIRPDEWRDQIADWAVYATLLGSSGDPARIAKATYDTAPLRLPYLKDALQFSYDPGRRLILDDGSVWLFFSARDSERTATLARLADLVRMELGGVPSRFSVFSWESDLFAGTLRVTREEDLSSAKLFSPEFGYVFATLRNAGDLKTFVESIDDVTHARATPAGLELGGRRFENSRTLGASFEDVGALYQAHQALKAGRDQQLGRLKAAVEPLEAAWKALIDAYNANVRRFNKDNSASLDQAQFKAALQAVNVQLAADRSNSWLGTLSINEQKGIVESLEPKVDAQLRALLEAKQLELISSAETLPSEPGFSLDPQWNVEGLISDLSALLTEPGAVIGPAIAEADEIAGEDSPQTHRLRNNVAEQLRTLYEDVPRSDWAVPKHHRERISAIIRDVSGKKGVEVEKRAIVPFLALQNELGTSDEATDRRLAVILEYIEAVRRVQCARYDGPLKGTRVGMNLFYTDLLAKLWSAVDYNGQAPTQDVYGFIATPREGPFLEPEFWDETWRLPGTRLWFGLKTDGYKGSPDEAAGLGFAPVATRVYAAGSNPLAPGAESVPNEQSRRAFGWWDSHFHQVAAFEREYQLQNQVMKWSVITGWMSEESKLGGLTEVYVDRSLVFDEWYASNQSLVFHDKIPILPRDRWLGGTECLEIIESETFPLAGKLFTTVQGGVSLASRQALDAKSVVPRTVPVELRRASLDGEASTGGKLTNRKGVAFEVGQAGPEGVTVGAKLPDGMRPRGGVAKIETARFDTSVSRRDGVTRIGISGDSAHVGTLASRRDGATLRLEWSDGSLEVDRRLAAAFKEVPTEESLAQRVSEQAELQADDAAFVIDSGGGGVDVVRLGGAGGGGGEPPRVFRLGAPDPGDRPSNAYLRSTGVEEFWTIAALLGPDSARKVRFEAFQPGLSEAQAMVDATRWQRLKLGGDDRAPFDRIGRVFLARGPPEGAIPAKLRTNDAELGDLNAFIEPENRSLWVERPLNASRAVNDRFNDLVTSEGLSPEYIESIATRAASADKSAPLQVEAALDTSSYKGYQAGLRASRGQDPDVAREELASIPPSEEARRGFEAAVARNLRGGLRWGRNVAAASTYDSPEARLAGALDSLRRNRPAQAAQVLQGVSGEKLSVGALEDAGAGLRRIGAEEAAEYLRLKSGDLSENLKNAVRLEPVGRRVHTLADVSHLGTPDILSSQGDIRKMSELFRRFPPGEIYVEDSRLLNRFEWDVAPGPSLAQVRRLPQGIIWEVYAADDLGSWRPSIFLSKAEGQSSERGERRLIRRVIPRGGVSPGGASDLPEISPHGDAIYVLRSCDTNDDGTIDPEEDRDCAAA